MPENANAIKENFKFTISNSRAEIFSNTYGGVLDTLDLHQPCLP